MTLLMMLETPVWKDTTDDLGIKFLHPGGPDRKKIKKKLARFKEGLLLNLDDEGQPLIITAPSPSESPTVPIQVAGMQILEDFMRQQEEDEEEIVYLLFNIL